jgi:hypothetical protein
MTDTTTPHVPDSGAQHDWSYLRWGPPVEAALRRTVAGLRSSSAAATTTDHQGNPLLALYPLRLPATLGDYPTGAMVPNLQRSVMLDYERRYSRQRPNAPGRFLKAQLFVWNHRWLFTTDRSLRWKDRTAELDRLQCPRCPLSPVRPAAAGDQMSASSSPRGTVHPAKYSTPTHAHTRASKASSYRFNCERLLTVPGSGSSSISPSKTSPSASRIAANSTKRFRIRPATDSAHQYFFDLLTL